MKNEKEKMKLKSRILSAVLICIGVVLVFVGYWAMQRLLERRQERLLSQSGEKKTVLDEETEEDDGERDKLTVEELEDILIRSEFTGVSNPHEPYGRQMTMQEAMETGQAWIESFCAKYGYPNADGTISYEGISAALYTGQLDQELMNSMTVDAGVTDVQTDAEAAGENANQTDVDTDSQTDAEDAGEEDSQTDAETGSSQTDAGESGANGVETPDSRSGDGTDAGADTGASGVDDAEGTETQTDGETDEGADGGTSGVNSTEGTETQPEGEADAGADTGTNGADGTGETGIQAEGEADAGADAGTSDADGTETSDAQTDVETDAESSDTESASGGSRWSSKAEEAADESTATAETDTEWSENAGNELAESMYGYWQLQFSGTDVMITMNINAVTGQVLYVSMENTSYTTSAENLPRASIVEEYFASFGFDETENMAYGVLAEDPDCYYVDYDGEFLFILESYVYGAAELGYPEDSGYTQSGFYMYVERR